MLAASAQAFLFASLSIQLPPPEGDFAEEVENRIVVTASRIEDSPADKVVTVGRDEIERRSPVSLLELLEDVPGVRAFSTGGIGGRSFLSIRGGEPNFTLVLIDGVKVNDPTNSRGGGFDFFAIDPASVERLEVARGAGSPVHGSDALSGVVNIRLRRPDRQEDMAAGRIQAGSGGDLGLSGLLGHGWARGGILVSGAWFDSRSLDPGSQLERWQALTRLSHREGPVDVGLLALHGRAARAAYPEDSGGPRFAASDALEQGISKLSATALTLGLAGERRLRPNLLLSWSSQSDSTVTPAIPAGVLAGTPALTASSRFSRLEAVADLRYAGEGFDATVGAAILDESGRSRGTIDFGFPLPVGFDLDRRTRSGFAEVTLRPGGGVELGLAGRYDDAQGSRGHWTGRAGVRWHLRPDGAALFASLSEGYKLPSFFALAHPLIGNPGLLAERSRNFEAGVQHGSEEGAFLRLTFFHNRFRDLIDFDPAIFRLVNRDRVRALGLELEGAWRPASDLALGGSISWLDLEAPTPLRGRPEWQVSGAVRWAASAKLEIDARLSANSWFHDSSIPTGFVLAAGHVEAALGFRYRFAPSLVLTANLSNLTDSRHEEAVGFPVRGRELRLSLEYKLF